MTRKRKILLISLFILSIFLGFPIAKYGLLVVEIGVWRRYFFHDAGLTTGYWLLPFGHLLLLSLFPLAGKPYYVVLAVVFPFIFLIFSVLAIFIFFFLDPVTLFVFVPFLVVWVMLVIDAFDSSRVGKGR